MRDSELVAGSLFFSLLGRSHIMVRFTEPRKRRSSRVLHRANHKTSEVKILITSDHAARSQCFHPNGSFIEFSREEIQHSIPERFEKIVRRHPDRLAIKTKNYCLTYKELNDAANRVAQKIRSERGAKSEPVPLLMEHDAPVIGAMLGILKAGKFYLPLDPSLPHLRLRYVLEDSQANYMVTNSKNAALAKSLAGTEFDLLNMDELDSPAGQNPGIQISPESLCWAIYTSGSTGKPKGVMQNHRNVLHYMMNYTNALHICADDRLTLLYSFSVNGGNHDIFAALLNGAALFPLDLKEDGFTALGGWLVEERITIYHSVPTVFRQFVEGLTDESQFPDLRIIRLGGEPVYKRELDFYRKHFSNNCILVNRLGSSETGSLRMYFINKETRISGNLVPVGYAVTDNEILLVDDAGKEIAGDEGEIAVKTRYVFPGYWGRPELTNAAFLPGPAGAEERVYRTGDLGRMLPDGCLLHLGRKDFFVKIRGYRVEIDEIETALEECPGIKQAVVVARGNNSGDERLVAYLVPRLQPGPKVDELRRSLNETLPRYMIPHTFVTLEAIPLTDTRKVDRKALPEPGTSRPELTIPYVAPATATEKELAKIWAAVLSLDEVGIHDNFFELGGHSLSATRIISRVIAAFELQLPIRALFDSPTIAAMADVISTRMGRKADEKDVKRLLSEIESLSEEKTKELLAAQAKAK
jgi:amino acid adenylation domain-containing protein